MKFYNERMLNIHQDISLFFSSQAIANCGWKNEQQTQVFKPLQKGQQIEITDIMHNRKSDLQWKGFSKKQCLLAFNKLSNSIFPIATPFERAKPKAIQIRIEYPISKMYISSPSHANL